jgi:hypothetical protein
MPESEEEEAMTPKVVKDNTKKGSAPTSRAVPGPALPAAEPKIDYAAMLEPLTKEDKSKKKGRGPSPHYTGLIDAFLKKTTDGRAEELKVNLDSFRAAIKKPDLPVASIRQGLRNNLHKTLDDDGRELWETIQVSVDNKTGMLTLKRRESKPRSD